MTDRAEIPAWVQSLPFHIVRQTNPKCLWYVSIETTRTLRDGEGDGFPVTIGRIPYNGDWVCNESGGNGPVEVIELALKRIHRDYLDQLDFDPTPPQRVILAKDYARAVKILSVMYEAAITATTPKEVTPC